MQMEHLFKLETDALDKFIEDLEETLNDANKTVYHTFEEFANTVQSIIDEAALKDTSESLQKIVDLISGKKGTALVDDLETAIYSTEEEYLEARSNAFEDFCDDLQDAYSTDSQLSNIVATVSSEKANGNLVDISDVSENTRFIELLQSNNDALINMNDDIVSKLSDLYQKATSIDNNISTIANTNYEVKVTNNYDSLLHVDGSVDATVIKNLKDLLEDSYKYTSKKLSKDLNSLGFYRTQR